MGGEYSEIHGNPYLKPEINYQLQLTYILKSKYIFNVWYSHTKDNATQTLYQSPDRLVEIYKYFNFDFEQQAGIQAVCSIYDRSLAKFTFYVDRRLRSPERQ